jgi:hypothetical protein
MSPLGDDDFVIYKFPLNYCKKNENPVNSVGFYNKYELNEGEYHSNLFMINNYYLCLSVVRVNYILIY